MSRPASYATGFAGLDRVLGGGAHAGSVVVLASPQRAGEVALLAQVCVRSPQPALYVAMGSEGEVTLDKAARYHLGGIHTLLAQDLAEVVAVARKLRPRILVIHGLDRVRQFTSAAMRELATEANRCAWATLLGVATGRTGLTAGTMELEFTVDTVLTVEVHRDERRLIACHRKNRHGSTETVWHARATPSGWIDGWDADP